LFLIFLARLAYLNVLIDSSKTDNHYLDEILLKVALNTNTSLLCRVL
jgi:hypothetical protein